MLSDTIMKNILHALYKISKYICKTITILRNIVFNIVFVLLLILFITLLFSQEKITIKDNTGLLLTITGKIVEEKQLTDPFNEILDTSLGLASLPQETLLQDLITAIDYAAEDRRITTIILDISQMAGSSMDQLNEIGIALERFKETGKKVIAAEDSYSQEQYYLAAFADEILLNPTGFVDIHGFAAYNLFFKEAIDKLKINFHIFRVGKYKSAIEPLTRDSMSDEARFQNRQWLEALWSNYRDHVAERRPISPDILNAYTNTPATLLRKSNGDTARLALDNGLVDRLVTKNELNTYLALQTSFLSDNNFRSIDISDYLQIMSRSFLSSEENGDTVGIIVAQGNILTGHQATGNIGSESIAELIREARNDDSLKALVLRINSGGGSAVASEMIRDELQEFKKSGKIFVVSMSGVAASGGYWIAADADEIWAYPTTLTGSIGIFGAVPTFEESLATLGIHSDGVGTTAISSSIDLTQPLSKEMQDVIQLSVEHGYQQFLDIVSNGRNIEIQVVEDIAQGRVYDGTTAFKLGLVDKLGGLDDAIDSAASMAGIEDYTRRYIESPKSFSEQIIDQLQQASYQLIRRIPLPRILLDLIDNTVHLPSFTETFHDPKGMYAHCIISYM